MRQKLFPIFLLILVIFAFSCKGKPKGWYQDSVIYHIWVKSFADSDDKDQVGDIKGIIEKLDYLNDGNPETLNDLGISAILLSPIFDCQLKSEDPNLNMHGYDVIDYYKVNPVFGNLDDVKKLLSEAHKRGIKVLFDFAPNHTSVEHPWFKNAKENGNKRDWYIWKDKPEENWEIPWGGGYWTNVWKFAGSSYYYTTFNVNNFADLNFRNKEVKEEINKIVKYWLDTGFDGMRVDAARHLIENGPGDVLDTDDTLSYFKRFRAFIDNYKEPSSKAIIAEAWESREVIKKYAGNGENIFHMAFDFEFSNAVNVALLYNDNSKILELLKFEKNGYAKSFKPVTFLCNHDIGFSRPFSSYSGNTNKCMQAAALNILSPGVPDIYYGNEIGMNGVGSKDANMRTFINWNDVYHQSKDPDSLLSWYRYFIQIKNKYLPISFGDFYELKYKDTDLISYVRKYNDESIIVILNLSKKEKNLDFDLNDLKFSSDIHYSELIGSFFDSSKSSGNRLFIKNMPPESVEIIYAGTKKQEKIYGYSKQITGGSKEKEISAIDYQQMYIRGSFNGWSDENPMKKISAHIWEVELQLLPLSYDFKFESSGKEIWEANWGGTTNRFHKIINENKLSKDGINLKVKPKDYGIYKILFNDKELSYNIKLVKKISVKNK